MLSAELLSVARVVGLAVCLASCGGPPGGEQAAPGPTATQAGTPTAEVYWGYEGTEGPQHWGELSPRFAACKMGVRQSPIDLANASTASLVDIQFRYRAASYRVTNTGHTIQANASDAGGITVDGERYELAQFHAHAPSEHTVDGEPADLELHLVHESSVGRLAVVGVLLHEGAANAALTRAWTSLPAQGETISIGSFDATTLLPVDRLSYRYEGSLTTPPCTEGVRWLVLKEIGHVDPATVSAFSNLFGPNARPVQPLNQRRLVLDNSRD